MTPIHKLTLSLLRAGRDPAQVIVALALRRVLRHCESVIDVGCGPDSLPKRILGQGKVVIGIEAHAPSVAAVGHSVDCAIQMDAMNLWRLTPWMRADACAALDVIEHLSKMDGFDLLRSMEQMAAKRCVLITPNGFLPQPPAPGNPHQEHLSGWTAPEMRTLGYRVYGLLGSKTLRGQYHRITGRPRALWWAVSMLSQAWTWTRPEMAAALLCVKEIGA